MMKTIACGACGTGATHKDKFCIECGATIVAEERETSSIEGELFSGMKPTTISAHTKVLGNDVSPQESWGDKEISEFWNKEKKPKLSERRGPPPNKRYLYGGEPKKVDADPIDTLIDTVSLAYGLPAVHDLHNFEKVPPQRPEPKLTSVRRRFKPSPKRRETVSIGSDFSMKWFLLLISFPILSSILIILYL